MDQHGGAGEVGAEEADPKGGTREEKHVEIQKVSGDGANDTMHQEEETGGTQKYFRDLGVQTLALLKKVCTEDNTRTLTPFILHRTFCSPSLIGHPQHCGF